MYAWNHLRRLAQVGVVASTLFPAAPVDASAAEPPQGSVAEPSFSSVDHASVAADQHQGHHAPQPSHEGHGDAAGVPATREGSGTSWLPDESPMYAVHLRS